MEARVPYFPGFDPYTMDRAYWLAGLRRVPELPSFVRYTCDGCTRTVCKHGYAT